MGLFARLVVFVLGAMSLVSLLVTAERLLAFLKARGDSKRYALNMEHLLASGRLHEAAQMGAGANGGYLGRVIDAGLKAFVRAQGASGDYLVDTVGRALERQSQRELQMLKRGQSIVATVAATAPFVGLLGTVMGIVTSFQAMASTGSGGLGTVSAGIAEALVTTAFGLLVAIPAVFAFNYLQSWVEARGVDLSESANELLDAVARMNNAMAGVPRFGDFQAEVQGPQSGIQSGPPSGAHSNFQSGFAPRGTATAVAVNER
jgi:biopolymer transport protein ExbB/biopolymer transport protein TolQ